jgi:Raf kinase inhibitor-like YbhB/YbcL family protein
MDLTSPDFEDGSEIPRERTCDGEGTAPELRWSGVPSGVVELALTCEDPDAPSGTFVHWAAWGIDPASGVLPPDGGAGIRLGQNGFGELGYGGPCPPPGHGPHHYEFTLYALDGSIDLEPGTTIDDLRSAIDGHIRATATLMGVYER